jgi:hypothetical protein
MELDFNKIKAFKEDVHLIMDMGEPVNVRVFERLLKKVPMVKKI